MFNALAFLGPAGTYGEQACHRLAALNNSQQARLCPQPTIRAVVNALLAGEVDGAVVPVENSVEGGVTSCLDLLWQSVQSPAGALGIQQALILPIRHALLSDGSMDQITEVLSHPQALAQCAAWLQQYLPHALQLPTSSTAEAARLVQGSRFRAAVASRRAGQDQGVVELAYPINDQQAIAPVFCCCAVLPSSRLLRCIAPAWRFRSRPMLPVRCWRPWRFLRPVNST